MNQGTKFEVAPKRLVSRVCRLLGALACRGFNQRVFILRFIPPISLFFRPERDLPRRGEFRGEALAKLAGGARKGRGTGAAQRGDLTARSNPRPRQQGCVRGAPAFADCLGGVRSM